MKVEGGVAGKEKEGTRAGKAGKGQVMFSVLCPTYTYIHSCTYTHTHSCVHIYTQRHIHAHTHTQAHICIHVCTYTYTHAHTCTCPHAHIDTYTMKTEELLERKKESRGGRRGRRGVARVWRWAKHNNRHTQEVTTLYTKMLTIDLDMAAHAINLSTQESDKWVPG